MPSVPCFQFFGVDTPRSGIGIRDTVLFPTVAASFYLPTSNVQGAQFLYILTKICYCCFFFFLRVNVFFFFDV